MSVSELESATETQKLLTFELNAIAYNFLIVNKGKLPDFDKL